MRTLAFVLSGLLLASTLVPSLSAGPVPRPAPAFTIQRPQQAPLQLSQFKGKVVALAFIHTTCSHCQELTRVLNKVQADYASRNVQVVAAAFEEGVATNFPMYMHALKPVFAAGITSDAAVKKFVEWNDKRDGMLMLPYMLFIDAKGVIRADMNGKDGFFLEMDKNVRAQLDKLTKPAAPAKAPAKKK